MKILQTKEQEIEMLRRILEKNEKKYPFMFGYFDNVHGEYTAVRVFKAVKSTPDHTVYCKGGH